VDQRKEPMAEVPVGSEFAGHHIEAVAGRGGMGVVYKAVDLALDRAVALKLIAPEYADDDQFRERFKRESKTAASIKHPHVITIYRAGDDDGRLYITMDYIDGTDLRAMIEREGRLEPGTAAEVVSQVASALDAAHGHGLVHRDVKPANVLMAGDGGGHHAYLTDFGLTKQTTSESGMTQTGMFVGTLDYVPPEQLQGGPLDARADIYSLGCVLYQTLTGQVPYPRDTEPAKLWAHMGEPPPSVLECAPNLPYQFEDVIKRAMAKDPNERYLSAGDLGRAALAAAEGRAMPRAERSVATGRAAPADATPVAGTQPQAGPSVPVPATEPAAPGVAQSDAAVAPTKRAEVESEVPPTVREPRVEAARPPGNRRRSLYIAGGAIAALAVVAVVLLTGGGSADKPKAPRQASRQAAVPSRQAAVPASEQPEVRRVVTVVSTTRGPSTCGLTTASFKATVFPQVSGPSAMSICRKQISRLPQLGRVTLRSVSITGTTATVPVVFADGEEGTFGAVKKQGHWLIDTYSIAKPGATRLARGGQGQAGAGGQRRRARR
jgi:hypothetical protein